MKKLLSFTLIIALLMVLTIGASAAAPAEISTEKADLEIEKNIDALYMEAVKNEDMIEEKAILENIYGEQYAVDIYQVDTSSITRNATDDNLDSVTLIASTDNITPLGTGSFRKEGWDSSNSIKAYITIYYSTQGSPTRYLLTKVSGGYNRQDTQVIVVSQEVKYGCSGVAPSVITQTGTKRPTTTSWTYNTGFTKYVVKDSYSSIGCNTLYTLKRGTTNNWTFRLTNNI